jgi:hypothetical protein
MPLAPLDSKYAETAIVLPSALKATVCPNSARLFAFEALTMACCDHAARLRVKT